MNKNMIKNYMTPRLEMIFELVPKSKVVCDIGTDHGYMAIKLIESKKAEKVIAADIKKGPLEAAKKNLEKSGKLLAADIRISNGFHNIGMNEAETAVIAGMGGETISEILKCDKGVKNFVLQPQTAHMELRKFLCENGFLIKDESLCKEGNKMYAAILAIRGHGEEFSRAELEIGPVLIRKKHYLLADYIDYRLNEVYTALEGLQKANFSENKKAEYRYLKEEYEKIKKGFYET